MKKYAIEEIYDLVGRDDRTASVTFIPGTASYQKFGAYVTVTFLYTQDEREKMDELAKQQGAHSGKVRAEYLVGDLTPELIKELQTTGIDADDILDIAYFHAKPKNTFHSQEVRTIKKIEIPLEIKPKGGDYDWIYGFTKKLITDGIGITPKQRNFYLAAKLIYEEAELTDDEKAEIYAEETQLREGVEWEYLQIKLMREEITAEETKRLGFLLSEKKKSDQAILDKYLQQVGSSMQKLVQANIDQAVTMLLMVQSFKEQKFNVMGKVPVYLDIDGFMHVYMRHVEEMKVNDRFEHKDNFQWATEDVFTVMKKVITSIDEEIQAFFIARPNTRYSRYGNQSVYFEGDYYTLHIELDGRISTFHKNRKKRTAAAEAAE
ncbi:hypothetical protein ACFFGT_03105 [Mucilaginibacter angelicae]|uniref:Uncharacterized protein n=1 Tax=Mucilaginibacter angelicae TaxID=869718 RepID=A0ABV6L0C5_9SPHI